MISVTKICVSETKIIQKGFRLSKKQITVKLFQLEREIIFSGHTTSSNQHQTHLLSNLSEKPTQIS